MIEDGQRLRELGIQSGSTVTMWVSMFSSTSAVAGSWPANFCTSLAKPVEEQTIAGQSYFNAVLYVVVLIFLRSCRLLLVVFIFSAIKLHEIARQKALCSTLYFVSPSVLLFWLHWTVFFAGESLVRRTR